MQLLQFIRKNQWGKKVLKLHLDKAIKAASVNTTLKGKNEWSML